MTLNARYTDKNNIYIYIYIYVMPIPNVAPDHLRSAKPPGMPKTAEFHPNLRFIGKTKFHKNRYCSYIYIYIYMHMYIET